MRKLQMVVTAAVNGYDVTERVLPLTGVPSQRGKGVAFPKPTSWCAAPGRARVTDGAGVPGKCYTPTTGSRRWTGAPSSRKPACPPAVIGRRRWLCIHRLHVEIPRLRSG